MRVVLGSSFLCNSWTNKKNKTNEYKNFRLHFSEFTYSYKRKDFENAMEILKPVQFIGKMKLQTDTNWSIMTRDSINGGLTSFADTITMQAWLEFFCQFQSLSNLITILFEKVTQNKRKKNRNGSIKIIKFLIVKILSTKYMWVCNCNLLMSAEVEKSILNFGFYIAGKF